MHSVNSKDSKSSPPVFPSPSRNSLGATEVKDKMLEDTADKPPDPRFNSSRHSLYQSSRRPILPLFSLTDTLHYWSQPHPLTKRLQGHLKLSYHDNRNGQSVRGQWYGLHRRCRRKNRLRLGVGAFPKAFVHHGQQVTLGKGLI